jgi:tight adherence protein B
VTPLAVAVGALAVAGLAVAALLRERSRRRRWQVLRTPPQPSRRPIGQLLRAVVLGAPAATRVAALLVGAGAGALIGGPVLAAVTAIYAAGGVLLLRRRLRSRDQAAAYRAVADAVAALAADLRAGLPVGRALAAVTPAIERARAAGAEAALVATRVGSAVAVAEASGAPLADVLDRLDTHLRAVDRARATTLAQAAGAHASAGLLAVLPIAGVGLSTLIGIDAWRVLLTTPVGATALLLAVGLQCAGLAWAARLSRIEVSV